MGPYPFPFPYIWRDVAIVHFLCAVPLAVLLSGFLHRRAPAAASVGLALFFLGMGIVPLLGVVRESVLPDLFSCPPLGVVLRVTPALALTLSAALTWRLLFARRIATAHRDGRGYAAALVGLWALVLLFVPWTYVGARCRHDVAKLGEYLEQSRLGEARTLLHALLALDADRELNGRPLPKIARDVDRIVADLESRVAVPLAADVKPGERLDRARQLAMLGRTDAALDVLDSLPEPAVAPDVDNLRGTIHETRGEWESSLHSYQSAREGWQARPPSDARAAGQLRATTGVAYCQRKLGRYAEAEANYRQLLALSPGADSHFLLAQFYEDTQQSEKARVHARRAMALDPKQYQQQGEKLIRKLTDFHFGCLGVFAAETDPSNTSPAP